MAKVKTSIYVDKELWEKFKEHARKLGKEVSRLLEEIMEDEAVESTLDDALSELAGREDYEIDFEPIEPKEGTVSELIRAMRDERANIS
jgi:post-segregation antitoxin (ccd killing protein)